MTGELHNHIAAMVCETDAPVKPADEKDAIDIMADLKRLVDDEGDVLARASLRLITDLRARAEAAEAREKALLENNEAERKTLIRHNAAHAARVAELTAKLNAVSDPDFLFNAMDDVHDMDSTVTDYANAASRAMRALIPTPAPSPDVPTPPDGWNVMKLGQVGWHVVQSANGWETSRIFGAECLLRSGGGDEFGPALDATPDGGRVAADAPTPSPDVGELVERVVRAKDTAGAFSKIELTEILAGRTEVAAFCLMLDNHVFPAVIAALAKLKGGAE